MYLVFFVLQELAAGYCVLNQPAIQEWMFMNNVND